MTESKNNEFLTSIGLVLGLLAIVGLIYFFVFSMAEDGFGKNMERVNESQGEDIAARIKPVMTIDRILGTADPDRGSEVASAIVAVKSPKELYAGACMVCHDSGISGSPKLGDTAAWEPRFATGMDALMNTALNGKGAMPPKGGSSYSEDEIRIVIEYMLSEAGLMEAPSAEVAASAPVPEETAATASPVVRDTPLDVEMPVVTASVFEGPSDKDLAAGEAAYRGACFACHDTGAAGAPMLGDQAQWVARIPAGFEVLLNSAIAGKGGMPPKGGAVYLSDEEVANIVAFMIERSK